MPKGELKAKEAPTQGTWVEEPERQAHQFLCTEEVGTPKGRALIGEKRIKSFKRLITRMKSHEVVPLDSFFA